MNPPPRALAALAVASGLFLLAITWAAAHEAGDGLLPEPAPTRWPVPASPDLRDRTPGLLDGLRSPPPRGRAAMPMPSSHTPAFLRNHGAAVGAPGEQACASCHTESQCSDCHAGLGAPVTLHPPGYLLLHGPEAVRNAATCASCHTPTRFCQSCHMDANVLPRPDAAPRPGTTIHPPGWLDPTAAVHHGTEARRDLLQCASCHTGESCASCHVDINPHGASFVQRCGRMLDAAAPTCAQCHTPGSRLPLPQVRTLCGR